LVNSSVGQLELALLRIALHTFERRFYEVAGLCYVELDEARAQSAKLRARFDPAAHRESIAAREQARLSAQACAAALTRPAADPEKLKRLHHDLARHFHPDLATEQAHRVLCEQIMTEINIAYRSGDAGVFEILLESLNQSGDTARELAELAKTPLADLRQRIDYGARRKQDLLAELTAWVQRLTAQERHHGLSPSRPSAHPLHPVVRALRDLPALSALSSSRRLVFPEQSMGEISLRAVRDIDSPVTVLGPAQRSVEVPFGKAVLLRLAKGCGDLSPLARLDPEDLHGLIDEWPDLVVLNDEMLRPLARFRHLEELRLGQTEITGRVFDDFPSLRELRVLVLDETQFDDAGLLRLEHCVWMQRLDLSFTQITGPGLGALHNMTSIRDFSLYGTAVRDADLSILDRVPGLRNLNLGLTAVTDDCAGSLRHLRALEVLNLGGTGITDAILDTLIQLPRLRDLVLWETAITPAGAEKIRRFPALRYLDLDKTGVPPEALRAFREARPEVRLPSDIWAEPEA
jgi:hypothetical protein